MIRTIKRLLISFILLIPGLSNSRAQDFQKIGTTGFVFLEIPVTARYVGMGETGITLPNTGASGLYTNPALITLDKNLISLDASFANWYVATRHQAIGFVYRSPLMGAIGIQLIYFDFGEIEKTINPTASQTGSYIDLGTFNAGALAFGLTYARALTDKFSFGATLKYIRETIDSYNADNFITDIGFLYFTGFESLRIGAFLQSFGLEARYADEKFKMPQLLKMGISGEVWGQIDAPNHLTLLAEAVHPNDADERIHIGLETLLINAIVLRAGYKFGYEEENLCLGAGLRLDLTGKRFGFDFSYMNHRYLDTTIRYTLTMNF